MNSIVITGASSGIGRALASAYAEKGEHVVACGRNLNRLADVAADNPLVETLAFDITDQEQVTLAASQIGPVDTLILNAGDCRYIEDAVKFDGELFRDVINTNLIATGFMLEAWLGKIRRGGKLVLVGSSVSLLPLPRAEAYGASKAGLAYLADSLAIDLKGRQIEVVLVSPGFVKTPLTDKNDFDMPLMVTAEEAAVRIIDGLERGKRHIAFPRRMIWMMKFMGLLPRSWWHSLAQNMVRSGAQ